VSGPVDIKLTVSWAVNGTRDMVEEGQRALAAWDAPEDQELAELRVYENLPIEALVMDEYGVLTLLRWNRREWVEVSGDPRGF
jgi:hypothetical protein